MAHALTRLCNLHVHLGQATPALMGLSVAAGALVARQALLALNAWRAAPLAARKFYEGGFEAAMSRDEALKILGLRCVTLRPFTVPPGPILTLPLSPPPRRHVASDRAKVIDAYRAAMQNAHTDKGGSDYLAMKVSEVRQRVGNGELYWRPRALTVAVVMQARKVLSRTDDKSSTFRD